jgi:hypothetical protein
MSDIRAEIRNYIMNQDKLPLYFIDTDSGLNDGLKTLIYMLNHVLPSKSSVPALTDVIMPTPDGIIYGSKIIKKVSCDKYVVFDGLNMAANLEAGLELAKIKAQVDVLVSKKISSSRV